MRLAQSGASIDSSDGAIGRSVGIGVVGSIGGGSSGPIGGTFLGSGTRGGSCLIGRCQRVIVSSCSLGENPLGEWAPSAGL